MRAWCLPVRTTVLVLAAAALWLGGPGPSSVCAQQGAAAAPPDAEIFYKAPDIESVRLSPSGRWLALSTGVGGQRVGLVVFDLRQWKVHAQAARFNDADITDVHWVNDEQLVFSIEDRLRGGGNQRWWPGLFAVGHDGSGLRQLVQLNHAFVVDRSRLREPLAANHELLHVPAGGGDEVIVGEWRETDMGWQLLPKRLNVDTGRATGMARGVPADASKWLFDPQGQPRVAISRREGRSAIHWRGAGDDGWRTLAEFAAYSAPFWPRYIDSAGALYVTVSEGDAGTTVLKRFDFDTGKPAQEALVRTPGFDFSGGLVSETVGGPALGVRAVTDAETTVWFDKRLAALQQQADQRLPGHVNRITCRRCGEADMTAVVHSWSDRDPGQFWIYTAADGAWRKVGDVRKDIDPRRMASTDFVRIRARDGLEVPVWLTLPPGPPKARPAVVLVHGGPWVRGRHWGWGNDAQFLASRGYAVIEPEFRGSTGYGQRHFRAGWRQWGQSMQDDVADALAWAVQAGHVDPARVCIAGASYGGYATLMGLVRHPGLYRCGVAWAAVTDPRLMYEWRADTDVSNEARGYSYPTLIGDPVKDAAMLESVSPLAQVARIQAPLLLAFGGADRRVLPVHGTRMRDALQTAGKPLQWVLYPDEGHGWFKLETRVDFARRMESFLDEHLNKPASGRN